MAANPPTLIDCPRCGNVNRVPDWEVTKEATCSMCGLTMRRANTATGDHPPAQAAQPAVPAPLSASVRPAPRPAPLPSRPAPPPPAGRGIREKIKPWLDIHQMAKPDDLALDDEDSLPEIIRPTARNPVPAAKSEAPPPTARPPDDDEDPEPEFSPAIADGSPVPAAAPAPRRRRRLVVRPRGRIGERLPAWVFSLVAPLAVTAGVALLGWMVYRTTQSEGRSAKVPASDEPSSIENPAEQEKTARMLAEKFVRATDTTGRLPLVRDPDRVRPLMEAFVPNSATGPVRTIAPFGKSESGESAEFHYLVTFEDGRGRLAIVVPTPDGPKIDWESFARHGTAGYPQLTSGQAMEADVRVLGLASNYYNYTFADDTRWLAIDLSNGDWESNLTGYVARGTPDGEALAKLVPRGAPPTRLRLRVRVTPESGPRQQCEILGLLGEGWVARP